MRDIDLSLEFGLEQIIHRGGRFCIRIVFEEIVIGCKTERANIDADPLTIGIQHQLGITNVGIARRLDGFQDAFAFGSDKGIEWDHPPDIELGIFFFVAQAGQRFAAGQRTKFTVTPGYWVSNSFFIPSHHSCCGVQSIFSSPLRSVACAVVGWAAAVVGCAAAAVGCMAAVGGALVGWAGAAHATTSIVRLMASAIRTKRSISHAFSSSRKYQISTALTQYERVRTSFAVKNGLSLLI